MPSPQPSPDLHHIIDHGQSEEEEEAALAATRRKRPGKKKGATGATDGIQLMGGRKPSGTGLLGGASGDAAADPGSPWAREWNRVFLLGCGAGLIVDPLFFYALSVSGSCMCLFVDGWFAASVTAVRVMVDAVHVWYMWLQLRRSDAGRMPRGPDGDEEDGTGGGGGGRKEDDGMKGHRSRRSSSSRGSKIAYLKSVKGFWLDLYVILPVPQLVMWVAAPAMIQRGSVTEVMTVLLISFLAQYLPKTYHAVRLLRRMQNLSGYVFGTIWWGVALNLVVYFVASHAAGACWYLLGIQRATKCLKDQCLSSSPASTCTPAGTLACQYPIYYGGDRGIDPSRLSWAHNTRARAACLDSYDNYGYGAFKWTVQLVSNPSRLEKVLFPIFWGLMTLSTFGNLESTTDWLEVVFNIVILTGGLLLVTMLIGNIKVFLQATTSKKQGMHLQMRNVEWWMKRRRLPVSFRQRVRQYERQRWAATRGVDEADMVTALPDGLRRDIKYHLCLDLVRQVPLFQHMDELVLENICDRARALIFPKGEVVTREGDPVRRMLFVVRGHLQSSHSLRVGRVKSYCTLGPGNFSGDELLSWCLRRPFVERLPPSSCTLVTLEATEAFGLDAEDVKYVTQHFRYTFVNEKVRRSARYYSPGWRTWAAVAIQLAWRRYRHRLTLSSLSFIRPRRPLSRCSSLGEERLRLYTALLTSPKPNQDDFSV